MLLLYTTVIAIFAGIHLCILTLQGKSPLSWEFLALIIIPLALLLWKDIKTLKFGKTGIELEFSREVNRYIISASKGDYLSKKEVAAVFESVKLNEWATIVLARMLMRKGLSAIAPSEALADDAPRLDKLIQLSRKAGKLSEQEAKDLEQLRNVSYYAEWGKSNHTLSLEDWNWAVSNAERIVSQLFEKQGDNWFSSHFRRRKKAQV